MQIVKVGRITIIATDGQLPSLENLFGNVLLALSPEDRDELERIARGGIAPLMALGFTQATAERIRKALGIRTYTGESITTRWRKRGGKTVLDELYAEAQARQEQDGSDSVSD